MTRRSTCFATRLSRVVHWPHVSTSVELAANRRSYYNIGVDQIVANDVGQVIEGDHIVILVDVKHPPQEQHVADCNKGTRPIDILTDDWNRSAPKSDTLYPVKRQRFDSKLRIIFGVEKLYEPVCFRLIGFRHLNARDGCSCLLNARARTRPDPMRPGRAAQGASRVPVL